MILILIGRSGSGKSAVARKLVENHGYTQVVTCTTRGRREGEAEDAYHFMSDEEFCERLRNKEFVESDTYGGNHYGMLKSSLEETDKVVAILTPDGAAAAKKAFPEAFVVHVKAAPKTAMLRAVKREKALDPAKIDKIAKRAMQDYYLYEDPACDLEIENSGYTVLPRLAGSINDEHEQYALQHMLKGVTGTLKGCREELEEYDRKKAEGQDV